MYLFLMALANDFFLIWIFIIRKNPKAPLLRKVGITYLSIFIPAAIIGIFLANIEMMESYYTIFLVIFLVFLGLEILYDYILKIDFRTNWKQAVPYLILYYAMNYGLVVMPWKRDLVFGIILLILFILQIIVNILTHAKFGKKGAQQSQTSAGAEKGAKP
nr:hypothetical protein [Candidatus Sigynarchaeota archaeon]